MAESAEVKRFIAYELARGNFAFDFAAKIQKTYLTHIQTNLEHLTKEERTCFLHQMWISCLKVALMNPAFWIVQQDKIEECAQQFLHANLSENSLDAIVASFASNQSDQICQLMQISSPLCDPIFNYEFNQTNESKSNEFKTNQSKNNESKTSESKDSKETKADELNNLESNNLESKSCESCLCIFCSLVSTVDIDWTLFEPTTWLDRFFQRIFNHDSMEHMCQEEHDEFIDIE